MILAQPFLLKLCRYSRLAMDLAIKKDSLKQFWGRSGSEVRWHCPWSRSLHRVPPITDILNQDLRLTGPLFRGQTP